MAAKTILTTVKDNLGIAEDDAVYSKLTMGMKGTIMTKFFIIKIIIR